MRKNIYSLLSLLSAGALAGYPGRFSDSWTPPTPGEPNEPNEALLLASAKRERKNKARLELVRRGALQAR